MQTAIWFLVSEAAQASLRKKLPKRWEPPHDPVFNPYIPAYIETEPDPEIVREMDRRPHHPGGQGYTGRGAHA